MTDVALVAAFLVLPALTVGLVGYPIVRMALAEDRAALIRELEREVDAGILTRSELAAVVQGRSVRREHLAASRSRKERALHAARIKAATDLGAQLRKHPRSSTNVVGARARLEALGTAGSAYRHRSSGK